MKAHITLTESIFTMGMDWTSIVALIIVVMVVVIMVVVQTPSEHSVHHVSVINSNHC